MAECPYYRSEGGWQKCTAQRETSCGEVNHATQYEGCVCYQCARAEAAENEVVLWRARGLAEPERASLVRMRQRESDDRLRAEGRAEVLEAKLAALVEEAEVLLTYGPSPALTGWKRFRAALAVAKEEGK